MRRTRTPLTTYRLQFHGGFRFGAARSLVAYLHELGVTDLYASPLLAAGSGSAHGYDVIDPTRINPDVGSKRALAALAGALRRRRMGLLLDIVPNHMAAAVDNLWWHDVLAQGYRSPYARFFDIDWEQAPPAWKGKVTLPVLGRPYRDSLAAGELRIAPEDGDLHLRCGTLRLPLDIRSWSMVIGPALQGTALRPGRRPEGLRRLDRALDRVTGGRAPRRARAAATWWTAGERELRAALAAASRRIPAFRRALEAQVERVNGPEGRRGERRALAHLLSMQNYRLIHWRDAGAIVNYRRFFNISDLVCLRMEDRSVFDHRHHLLRRLVRSGFVQGLRIDHVDGLREPGRYLRRLRAACGRPLYTVVEKILVGEERLPAAWPVAGTTGYDFLNMLNRLFVEPRGASRLGQTYTRFTRDRRTFEDLVYRAKRRLLASDFRGQMEQLGRMCLRIAGAPRARGAPPARRLIRALEVTTACVPIYRTYIEEGGRADDDRRVIRAALSEARRRAPSLPSSAFTAVEKALLPRRRRTRGPVREDDRRAFIMRWQQLTGPLMAKGHEDTALYIDHRLTSLNEVGGSPAAPGLTVAAFHRLMRDRRRRSPITMNATSTHDTKRGEDVRARINVLTEMPGEWSARLREWHRWNRHARARIRGREVPTAAEEVLIYQTLLGAWPARRGGMRGFAARVKEYLIKAAREAKEHTSWNDPDTRHEAALQRFVDVILDRAASRRFLHDFGRLQRRVALAGAVNSLAQVVIKATAPGVPDFYQGSELWDLSLVDPDNRRPIDFARRRSLLARLQREAAGDRAALLRDLLADPLDGRIKLYATWRSLQLRKRAPDLFLRGRYDPLAVTGRERGRICAFARRLNSTWTITVAPRFTAPRVMAGGPLLGEAAWGTGAIRLPRGAPRTWRDALTGGTVRAAPAAARAGPAARAGALPLAEVLDRFPVALLVGRVSRRTPVRNAGRRSAPAAGSRPS